MARLRRRSAGRARRSHIWVYSVAWSPDGETLASGSTGLEALRLGCEAHGVELNPVAYLIELCTLVYPQQYGQPIPRSEYEARPGTLPDPESEGDQAEMDFDTDI